MNWFAVRIVFTVLVALACVISSAVMMANIEYGPTRVAAWFAALSAGLFTAFALLLGSVV